MKGYNEYSVAFARVSVTDSAADASSPAHQPRVLQGMVSATWILLCGDIGDLAQGRLMASGVDLRADVLLLPHHGGIDATTQAFVEAVDPRYVIQSSFRRTEPTVESLGPILEGRVLFNTADDGAVQVVLGDEDISVTAFRSRTATGPALAGTQ